MSELAKTNEEAFMDAYRTVMNTSKSFAPRIQQLRKPIEQLLRKGVDMKVITKALNKYGIPCEESSVRGLRVYGKNRPNLLYRSEIF